MFNKNLIAGLVAIALLAGGLAFYFLNGNSVSNLPVAKNGELTRELAEQIILKQIFGTTTQASSSLMTFTVTGVSMQSETKAMVNLTKTIKYEDGKIAGEIPDTLTFYLYDDGWKVDMTPR